MNLIKKTILSKIKDGQTGEISFTTPRGDFGHVQFSTRGLRSWDIFLNCKCVSVSKTWQTCERKLWLLGLTLHDFDLEQ